MYMSNQLVLSNLRLNSQHTGGQPRSEGRGEYQQYQLQTNLDTLAKDVRVSRMKKLTLLCAVLLASSAWAATLKILTLDEMTQASSAVVQGRILASRSDWLDGKGSLIVTYYTVQADSYLKGNLGRTFQLTEPGGTVGMISGSVPGAPSFQVGEQVLLFIETGGSRNIHQAIGFEQGVFRVQRDARNGALTVNHSQPLIKGGQVVSSDENPSLVSASRTSRDLNQFLSQVGDSARRVATLKKGVQQ
jgi:hypothetical protein